MTRQRFRWRSDKNEKKSGGKEVTIPENTENANMKYIIQFHGIFEGVFHTDSSLDRSI